MAGISFNPGDVFVFGRGEWGLVLQDGTALRFTSVIRGKGSGPDFVVDRGNIPSQAEHLSTVLPDSKVRLAIAAAALACGLPVKEVWAQGW